MKLDYNKLSKVSNRNIIEIAKQVSSIKEDLTTNMRCGKLSPTSLDIKDRIGLETYLKNNKKIIDTL